MSLLDARGRPVSSQQFKKAPGPQIGEAFTTLYGDSATRMMQLPQGGTLQFNLDNLRISDFRSMRSHYQVNASLAVLTFMQHQSDWHIECDNPKIAKFCEEQVRGIWTPLNRAMGTANWAGYSPMILQWDNEGSKTMLTKIKDLLPEACEVHWKEVNAWVPPGDKYNKLQPKAKVYDGIKQLGAAWPTPVGNTLWYPLLMENGNYNGTKLLKAAFQSWYFSILIHLFANRYYERFGEPIVVGRAPFEDYVKVPGTTTQVSGIEYMVSIMKDLRNRSVVALPDEKTEMSNGRVEFDYQIEYLESQMRGADWERYLTRLDEEISIGLFTPILLLRTADVGSYNLGVGHMQMYLWMLNAMNSDRAVYFDKYILSKMVDYNFGTNAPRARIKFRKLGNQNADVVRDIIKYMTGINKVKFDIQELGEIAGMTMEEVEGAYPSTAGDLEQEAADAAEKAAADAAAQGDTEPTEKGKNKAEDGLASGKPRKTAQQITARVGQQIRNHLKKGSVPDDAQIHMGFARQMTYALAEAGVRDPEGAMQTIYNNTSEWVNEVKTIVSSAEDFETYFSRVLANEISAFV